jgi:hypothetical protein
MAKGQQIWEPALIAIGAMGLFCYVIFFGDAGDEFSSRKRHDLGSGQGSRRRRGSKRSKRSRRSKSS